MGFIIATEPEMIDESTIDIPKKKKMATMKKRKKKKGC
jgi:hypothetical protein